MKVGVDYIGVSAGAVITNSDGTYFLARRGPGARDDVGTWEFPGGMVGFYETRKDAVPRIIAEKLGFKIAVDKLLGVYDVIDHTQGDHWVSTTYLCHVVSGEPKIMDDTKFINMGWFTLDQLRDMDLSRITRLNIADL